MLKFDVFEFDEKTAKLTNVENNQSVILRQKLVALLIYLSKHHVRVVSKQELLEELWDHGQYRERSLSQSILELRKALGDSASDPKYIRTIPNKGYQWICPERSDATVKSHFIALSKLTLSRKLFLLVGLLLIGGIYWGEFLKNSDHSSVMSTNNPVDSQPVKVLVLPFINQSGTSAMNWVQYGLSEMLAFDLAVIKELNVIAPTQFSTSNYSANFSVDNIQALLVKYRADVVIRGVFSLEKSQQLMTYQLVTPQGASNKKVLRRTDLAVSMPEIASEIYRAIQPSIAQINLPKYAYAPSAMHDFARGLQALQTDSYILAQHYFKASIQIDENHQWSALYQAISQLQLGRWQQAQELLSQFESSFSEAGLLAEVHYWQALLAYRKGQLVKSSEHLTASTFHLANTVKPSTSTDVEQLKKKISQFTHTQTTDDVSGKHEFYNQDYLFEVPLFNQSNLFNIEAVADIDLLSRQLTIKGYKPALLKLLISHSLSTTLSETQRTIAIARAVSIARELQQPYDLALTLIIQGRIAIAQRSALGNVALLQAKQIANGLKALPLLEEVEFYLAISKVMMVLDVEGDEREESIQLILEGIDLKKLNTHKKVLLRKATQWIRSK